MEPQLQASLEPCNAILVVEDDDLIRETLQFALELAGYKVFTAANGREGIDLLGSIPRPCLILLDLMMPVMNGWEFADAVEHDEALTTIPIVVVTAFADKATSIRARGVLSKPASLAAVLAVAEECCAGAGDARR
ncbi:MAG: response regulator [Kofleriaceae bacterium]|nr:response regulator [Kofleriaceae bacterium]